MSQLWPRALLAGVLLLAACGSTPPRPAPSTRPSEQGMAQRVRDADPCGFLRSEGLARFGSITVKEGIYFTQCDAELVTAAGKLNLDVELQAEVSDMGAGNSALVPATRKGRQVFGYGAAAKTYGCLRDIRVSDEVVIGTRLSVNFGPGADYSCRLADDIADELVGQLNNGALPAIQQPANSLAHQDACRLLERPEIAEVPDVDPGRLAAGFRGQHCTWGEPSITAPSLLISFSREEPHHVRPDKADTAVTIGGRPAIRTIVPANEHHSVIGPSLGGCEIDVLYRPLDGDPARAEVLGVSIATVEDGESVCALVTELATIALTRLPD